jgi:serine/threonine protein phosphatase PrpC
MEDRHVTVNSLWTQLGTPRAAEDYPRAGFFAVYDGHGGVRAARVAETMLHNELTKQLFSLGRSVGEDEELVHEAIVSAFARTEAEVVACATKRPGMVWEDGCTACGVLLLGDRLYSANLGDSRAVLCRGVSALALTRDHKPGDPAERQRIQRAGGFVRTVAGIDRVMGDLSVSRALGDLEYKPHIVSAVPDVVSHVLVDIDAFIIIACDGLWDVLSPQEAVDHAHRLFRRAATAARVDVENVAGLVALGLVEYALQMPACDDNVSVVVVALSSFVAKLEAGSAKPAAKPGASAPFASRSPQPNSAARSPASSSPAMPARRHSCTTVDPPAVPSARPGHAAAGATPTQRRRSVDSLVSSARIGLSRLAVGKQPSSKPLPSQRPTR